MTCNLSTTDRTVRCAIGAALVVAAALFARDLLGILIALVGAVLILSGTVGFCHVYKVLGIRTLKKV